MITFKKLALVLFSATKLTIRINKRCDFSRVFKSLNFLGQPVTRLVISTTVILQQQQNSYPCKTEITSVISSIPSGPIMFNLAA